MKFVDIVDTTRKALAQTLGTEYMEQLPDLAEIDSYKLVDIGHAVAQSERGVDAFVKAISTIRGKLVIETCGASNEFKQMLIDSFEWGSYVEVGLCEMGQIQDSDIWNLVDGQTVDDNVFWQPKVRSKIFEEAKAIMCPYSISEEAAMMSFNSWSEMGKLIGGIEASQRETLETAIDVYAHALASCGAAISVNGTETAVHLITEATAAGICESTIKPEEFLNNDACITFMLKRIYETKARMMGLPNAAFNNHQVPVRSRNVNLALLLNAVSSAKFDVKANTYNDEEIGIGEFDVISAWQGIIDDNKIFDYNTVSTIKIAADANNKLGLGTAAVTVENVVGLAYDKRALVVCPFKQKTTGHYNGRGDFNNIYLHMLLNMSLNNDFPIVAFVLD